MRRYLFFMMVLMIAMSALTLNAFAQDNTKEQAAPDAASAPAAAEVPKVTELSIYGEVQSVNMQANSMMVQYYDYDTDEERSAEIVLDSASKLDNAKSIGDIKKGDWVDVTYTASAGKNTAKIVSVEKEEPAQDENAPAAEN